jgi:uncharacterized integral membrane protein
MQNLWLKIKIWTKIAIAVVISLYVLIFVLKNGDRKADFWFWFGREYSGSLLSLVFFAFLTGGLVTLLATTTFRTIRQIRELRARSRTAKLEDEVRDMRSKAAMLQTKPAGGAIPAASTVDVIPPDPDSLPPNPSA